MIRELLQQQAGRIEVKAASHELAGTAGVLYAQHLRFIQRLLRELKT